MFPIIPKTLGMQLGQESRPGECFPQKGMRMKIRAPAKLNLGLKVSRRRRDGYHEIESILQQISLSDYLIFEPAETPGWSFKCSHPRLGGRDNLVCQAAQMVERAAGKRLPGVNITLFKNIPIGSGLGGGSSDAAAALIGLNKFWKMGLSTRDLAGLGAILGSDIPFFLQGGTALARGRGEIIDPLPQLPFFWVVLALPPRLSLSTASVYASLGGKIPFGPSPGILQKAVTSGDREGILNWLCMEPVNSLQPAVLARHPSLRLLKNKMEGLGLHPVMSGSGPALFALSDSYLLSNRAAMALQAEGYRATLCWTISKTMVGRC